MPREPRAGGCPAGVGERVVRAILAVALAGFAVGAVALSPWLAVALGLAAAAPAFGAVTGHCPTDYLGHRPPKRNTIGLPEARQPIDVGPKE